MTSVLLSVKPVYANALLAGTKTAEIRRRFPTAPPGTTVFIYASSPVRALLGTVQLDEVTRAAPDEVWRDHHGQIQIDRESLADYLHGREEAVMLWVSSPHRWEAEISLHVMRSELGLEPPQSFRYLSDDHVGLVSAIRESALAR